METGQADMGALVPTMFGVILLLTLAILRSVQNYLNKYDCLVKNSA